MELFQLNSSTKSSWNNLRCRKYWGKHWDIWGIISHLLNGCNKMFSVCICQCSMKESFFSTCTEFPEKVRNVSFSENFANLLNEWPRSNTLLLQELGYQSSIKAKDRHPHDKFVETIASFVKVSKFAIQEIGELMNDMQERVSGKYKMCCTI